jgi:hypothetical protein
VNSKEYERLNEGVPGECFLFSIGPRRLYVRLMRKYSTFSTSSHRFRGNLEARISSLNCLASTYRELRLAGCLKCEAALVMLRWRAIEGPDSWALWGVNALKQWPPVPAQWFFSLTQYFYIKNLLTLAVISIFNHLMNCKTFVRAFIGQFGEKRNGRGTSRAMVISRKLKRVQFATSSFNLPSSPNHLLPRITGCDRGRSHSF